MTNFKGFSLIEVLVFVTVISMFFVSAVTVTTFSLKNSKLQQHKILATRYAEEGMEWVKEEKEEDWQVFTSYDPPVGGGTNYCLNSLDTAWLSPSNCGSNYTLGSMFKRVLVIRSTGSPVTQVTANLTVSWLENNVIQNVILKSVYNIWE